MGYPKKLVYLLTFWYSNQQMSVRWQKTKSNSFGVGNGVRQGSILSPLLFNFYIHNLILSISNSCIRYNIGGIFMNVLAYTDDMVLIALSWSSLQKLISFTNKESSLINMSFNTKKTVCMMFNLTQKSKIISNYFPELCISGCKIAFVETFKYLSHIIKNDLTDDLDITKEMKGLYTSKNILFRRFHLCSTRVKVKLFKSYCICLYGAPLWQNYNDKTMARFSIATTNVDIASCVFLLKLFQVRGADVQKDFILSDVLAGRQTSWQLSDNLVLGNWEV
ncbi:uncharacterized protein LOC124818188 [Hydra vulgaris]|uniref:uncharacterized protein LOC124818188 n=1 Tax=Hydra vulgaris TaxID=6087 RepID=UPI001F5E59B0|nr:uncharacterized protein LOC124818188 [Hydra vulgaris]